MPTKPAASKKTSKVNVEKPVAAAAPVRAAAPRAPRVTTVKHSKPAVQTDQPRVEKVVNSPAVNSHEAIAKIAYGYWESRGYQGGNQTDDWFHAEAEYKGQL